MISFLVTIDERRLILTCENRVQSINPTEIEKRAFKTFSQTAEFINKEFSIIQNEAVFEKNKGVKRI